MNRIIALLGFYAARVGFLCLFAYEPPGIVHKEGIVPTYLDNVVLLTPLAAQAQTPILLTCIDRPIIIDREIAAHSTKKGSKVHCSSAKHGAYGAKREAKHAPATKGSGPKPKPRLYEDLLKKLQGAYPYDPYMERIYS